MMFKGLLTFYRVRVEWDYPNPNPKLRVPAAAGNGFLGLSSGSSFYYPNFSKPELPDPIGSGNPNAQTELARPRPGGELEEINRRRCRPEPRPAICPAAPPPPQAPAGASRVRARVDGYVSIYM